MDFLGALIFSVCIFIIIVFPILAAIVFPILAAKFIIFSIKLISKIIKLVVSRAKKQIKIYKIAFEMEGAMEKMEDDLIMNETTHERMNENIAGGALISPVPNAQAGQLRDIENARNIVNLKWFQAYWLLFWLLCIVLIESLFKSGIALGTVIWFVFAEVLAISFAFYCTGKLNKKALLLCIPIGLINIGHLLFYSTSTQMITFGVALALFALQLTYLAKPEKDRLFDFKNVFDMLHTVFVNAFEFIPYPFKGLLRFNKEQNKRTTVHILLGLAISLPIAGIFLYLFSSADRAFAKLVGNFASGLFSNFGVFIADLVIGAIMCIFVSAAFVGANARELRPQSPEKAFMEVNNVILGTVLGVVAVVVALYVGIQFNHWFGNVPVNYIQMDEYANLARSGFFELVWASCFLLALIIAVTMISTKRNDKLIPLIKAPLLLLCGCNLVVLYSAVEKMVGYIARSGITPYRVLVLWLIAVIVVLIVGAIIKIMRFSFKAFNFSCAAVIALVCALSFCNMDYYVAKNHIYLAEHHKIQNLEQDMLSGLSYAAAAPLAEYKRRLESGESVNESTKMQDKGYVLILLDHELRRHKWNVDYWTKENPLMGFNFSRLSAQKALRGI